MCRKKRVRSVNSYKVDFCRDCGKEFLRLRGSILCRCESCTLERDEGRIRKSEERKEELARLRKIRGEERRERDVRIRGREYRKKEGRLARK